MSRKLNTLAVIACAISCNKTHESFVTNHVFLILISSLDAATHLLVDECEPAIRIALTLVLKDLAIRSLKQERGDTLHRLALRRLRILRRVYKHDLAFLSTNLNGSTIRKLCELRFHCLTVWAPISVVHCKSVHSRGRTRLVLETLETLTE